MRSFVFVVCFLGFTNVYVRSDQDIEAQFHAMVAHLPYHRLMDVNETWCLDIAGRPIPRENGSVYCYTGALIVLSDDASEATVFQLDNETLPDKVKQAIPDEAFATGLGESIKYLKSVSSNSTTLLSESLYQNKVYALLSLEPPLDRQRFRGMVKRREYNYELVKAENISLYARMAVEGVANIHIVESNSSDHPIFHAVSERVLRRDFGGKTTSIRFIEEKHSEMEAMNRNFGKECFVEGCWIKGREKCCLMENNPLKVFRRSVVQIVANNDTCFDYNTALLNETIPPPNGTDHCVFRYNPVLEFSPMEARNVRKGECKSATIRQAEVFGIKTYGREITCNFDLTKPIEENRKKLLSQQRICMNSTEKKGNAIACEYLIERSTASGSTKLTVLEGKNIWAVIQDDFREVIVPNRCFFLREDQKKWVKWVEPELSPFLNTPPF
uniref:Uncharacterized protein n=1 Tax=Bursaphelenchus xylophilus TaxID=6326 RepID=A0A1I7SUN1_BURXY